MRADRAQSDENRTQIFSLSFYYEIPAWKSQHGVLGKALGGWTLSGLTSAQSGAPFNILSGVDNSLTAVGWDRPNLVGDPSRSYASENDMLQQFFNIAAFAANKPGQYGNVGRNLLTGPAQGSTDVSLVKAFPISERLGKIKVRAEFFNALNQVNFGQPVSALNNRNFGKIQTAGDPRILQFALRYQF